MVLAFTIHPSDTLKPNVYADNAPSRPPSRASTQVLTTSNGVGKRAVLTQIRMIRLTKIDTGATESPNMANQEEDDLSRAMAMSLNDGRNLAGQETGTIEHSKSTLAPANREHYDPAQWAMTYAGSHTQEILLNPEPTNRKRSKNTPAFFKPSSTGHRLPALIKILHAVPMAREALLNRNQTLPEYGYEKEWWNGTTIKVLRNVNIGTEGRRVNEDNIIYETQRLMAFLDESDRAYGSTAVLANLEGNELRDGEMMSDFLTAWQTAAAHTGEPLANIFESIGIKRNLIHPETVVSSASRRFDLSITHELYGRGLTLYEAVDNLLWGDANEDEEVFCEKLGDVVVFEVNNGTSNGSGLGIDIPATWYADRYLSSFRSQAKDMLARKAAIEYEMRKEEEKQSSITEFHQSVSSARLDAAQLLSKSTAYFEQTVSYQGAIKGISGSGEKSFGDKHQNLAIPHLIAEELKALTDRISQKLKGTFYCIVSHIRTDIPG